MRQVLNSLFALSVSVIRQDLARQIAHLTEENTFILVLDSHLGRTLETQDEILAAAGEVHPKGQ